MKRYIVFVLTLMFVGACADVALAQGRVFPALQANRLYGKDSVVTTGLVRGATANFSGAVTLSGAITASSTSFSKIDSFTTTGATKAVTMTGASSADHFIVQPITTATTTTPDTASYYCKFDSAGYVTVGRIKSASVGAYVSAAKFILILFNK